MNELLRARKRVVITGLGAVTPAGLDVDSFWESLITGKSGIKNITNFDTTDYPCKFAGEIQDFDPNDIIGRKQARRMARFSQLLVVAANEALVDSGIDLDASDRDRIGIVTGCGGGGFPGIEEA